MIRYNPAGGFELINMVREGVLIRKDDGTSTITKGSKTQSHIENKFISHITV